MRTKLKRYSEINKRVNVLQSSYGDSLEIAGMWNSTHFMNENDIVLELACGKGEYSVGMARLFPEKNFVGIDIKGDRLWQGSHIALEESLLNVAFLRTEILQLQNFFVHGEVSEIWITFPDPRPRDRDEKRRLTSNRFLDIYKTLISNDGWVRLKTDNTSLFNFTIETLQSRNDIQDLKYTFDLYYSNLKPECFDIRTRYEQKFNNQGHDIKYLKFRFKSN